MELLPKNTNIDFLKVRKVVLGITLLVVVGTIASLATRGLNFSVDFTGGVLLEVGYPHSVELDGLRDTLAGIGYDDAMLQHYGTTSAVLIRLQPKAGTVDDEKIADDIMRALAAKDAGVAKRRVEFVGPQVGDQLVYQGALATLFALLGILVYVWFRFEWKFGLGAIVSTAHDVVFVLGWLSFFQVPFDLTVLAAVLTVVGYSLNDTVVIFDRIRENFRLMRRATVYEMINASVNQTMSRTIMTGLTVMLVLVVLFAFGGEVVHGFSLTLIIGVLIGTVSSVYVASQVALMLGLKREDLLEHTEKDEALEKMP